MRILSSPKELGERGWDNMHELALEVAKLYVNENYVLRFLICQPVSLGCAKPQAPRLSISQTASLL